MMTASQPFFFFFFPTFFCYFCYCNNETEVHLTWDHFSGLVSLSLNFRNRYISSARAKELPINQWCIGTIPCQSPASRASEIQSISLLWASLYVSAKIDKSTLEAPDVAGFKTDWTWIVPFKNLEEFRQCSRPLQNPCTCSVAIKPGRNFSKHGQCTPLSSLTRNMHSSVSQFSLLLDWCETRQRPVSYGSRDAGGTRELSQSVRLAPAIIHAH